MHTHQHCHMCFDMWAGAFLYWINTVNQTELNQIQQWTEEWWPDHKDFLAVVTAGGQKQHGTENIKSHTMDTNTRGHSYRFYHYHNTVHRVNIHSLSIALSCFIELKPAYWQIIFKKPVFLFYVDRVLHEMSAMLLTIGVTVLTFDWSECAQFISYYWLSFS